MNVGQELIRRLKRFTDNMENKMNTRYEPIYVSNLSEHGFPATKIDWDKKEEPTMKAVAWMVEDFKGIDAIFPNEHDAYDFANEKHRNKVDCSVVPLYRSLPTAMKFLPPAPPPSCVVEGWVYLNEDDILQEGDECEISLGTWMPTLCIGDRVGKFSESYRRRVTPVRPPLLSCVEEENVWLTAEVERLRLLPEERAAIKRMIGEPDNHPSWAESRCAKLLRDMLKRQGGGE